MIARLRTVTWGQRVQALAIQSWSWLKSFLTIANASLMLSGLALTVLYYEEIFGHLVLVTTLWLLFLLLLADLPEKPRRKT